MQEPDSLTRGSFLQALWKQESVAELFTLREPLPQSEAIETMQQVLRLAADFQTAGKIHDEKGKLSQELLQQLTARRYWGMLVPEQYGGSGAKLADLVPFLTKLATINPTIAGLQGVHGCIGPVNQLVHFGNDEQRARLLPPLARGERIGVFGLTEPNAGSDVSQLRTTAVRDGNDYVITGEKLFITNLLPGRTMGLVCRIEGQNAVLIVELPQQETPEFQLTHYGLHSLQHTHNHGALFRGLRVPVENRLEAPQGDGLRIAYHGLNRGRVSLCANAAGSLRTLLAHIIPWVKYRRTFGHPIADYQLVARRVGRLAVLSLTAELAARWAAQLLDAGERGEVEGIIAKTWAADALSEAATELVLKTHGGRAFLAGHAWGDHLHDFLAPSIYEGENEILLLALFKTVSKPHAREFYQPLFEELERRRMKNFNPGNPWHVWQLRQVLRPLVQWRRRQPKFSKGQKHLLADRLAGCASAIDYLIATHGVKLANEQIAMLSVAKRLRTTVIERLLDAAVKIESPLLQGMPPAPLTALAEAGLAREAASELSAGKSYATLGRQILDNGWPALDGIQVAPILRPYAQS
jgi:alkylation response protein AidB-like acyl-CoA dehydrogenase